MANVRYQMSGSKTYNYQGNILNNAPITLTVAFTADVPDPESANLTPYYRTQGASDNFFQSILSQGNLKFLSSSIEASQGENRDNNFCSWSEVYGRIEKENDLFDTNITINVPAWRLRFVDLISDTNPNESRRLRQAYGYTPLSGSFSARTNKLVTDWRDVFMSYNSSRFFVDNATITESWENGERIFSVNVSWKAYDLSSLPRFKENL